MSETSNRDRTFMLRLTESDFDKLSTCANAAGVSRAEFLRAYICSSFDQLNGSPELRELLDQMKILTERAKSFGFGVRG